MVTKEKMMKKILLAAMMALAAPTLANAETITANVNGLVCGFCAKSIEKAFGKTASVQSVKVDLDKKTVVIVLKPQAKLLDGAVTRTITDAGYKVVKISRVA
jgi:copper chaperone CopZ